MESIIEKLKKIQVLAQRGEMGEMQAAKRKLEELLAKYGLTLDDLNDNALRERVLTVPKDVEILFVQCCFKIIGAKRTGQIWYVKSEKHAELTDMEYIELRQLFDFHRANYRCELKKLKKDFENAYQFKHGLYCSDSSETTNDKPLSRKEIEAIIRLSSGLSDVTFHKAIESTS
jgi:hypothetical protein